MKDIRSIDEAYGELALGIKDFVKDRPWDSASCECRLFQKMVQSSHWCISGGVQDAGGVDWPDTSIAVGDAAIFLRNHLLKTTGSRDAEASAVADHLVDANLAGHDSHGVGMLPDYVAMRHAGLLN